MEKLNLEDFLVVKKKSRLEVDAMKMGLDWTKLKGEDERTLERIGKMYDKEFIKRNLEAQRELYNSVDFLLGLGFKEGDIIEREELEEEWLGGKKAVIALGGDNHLIWVSNQLEYLGKSLPLIGCKASGGSVGGILYDNRETIKETLERCARGGYRIEKWPKIGGEILFDGKKVKLFPATQEYFFGEYATSQNSRWVLSQGDKREEQRGDNLLIVNGVGSTGWYKGIHLTLFGREDNFSREAKEVRYITNGPGGGKERYKFIRGKVKEGEILELVSYNDSQGVATTDCIDEERYVYEFSMGSRAKVWVSDRVTKVIKAD